MLFVVIYLVALMQTLQSIGQYFHAGMQSVCKSDELVFNQITSDCFSNCIDFIKL